jgi:RsmE family RNA methyltransferase
VNLLLFEAGELDGDGTLLLRDRRRRHLSEILGAAEGDTVRVGQLDGQRGEGLVEQLDGHSARLRVRLDSPPPSALDLTLVLALPRPKMLRRILRGIAEVGIKQLHLIHSYRVEKSYWQSPLLRPQPLRDYLIAGLEQASDTVLPSVSLHRRFRPFAEDTLPGLLSDRHGLLASPHATRNYPASPPSPALLAIGPEGGFIPFEENILTAAGCRPVSLGARILRVETALHCALGRHLPGEV